MSTCDVIDTEDWQGADVDTIGAGGFGVLGTEIASSGDAGAGYAYNDLELPADAGKEICGRITSWPAVGTLYAYEDTSFTYSRTGDGTDSFQYQLYVDGDPIGAPQTVTLAVGVVSASAPGATLTSTSNIVGGVASGGAAGSVPGATFNSDSTIAGGVATGEVSATATGATLTSTASIHAGAAAGSGDAIAAGAELTANSFITGGVAGSITYARAPAGGGYAPRSDIHQSRPPAMQGQRP